MRLNKINQFIFSEAEKVALVAKIQWDQKIMEKESQKKISEIEGKYVLFVTPSLLPSSVCKTVSHRLVGFCYNRKITFIQI